MAGKISVGGSPSASKLIDAHNTVTLTNNGQEDGITVTTFDEPADFVFLAAKPIGEPIVQHGQSTHTQAEAVKPDQHTLRPRGDRRMPAELSAPVDSLFSRCSHYFCLPNCLGPFVLNDRQGVMEAIMDFQQGRNGFERAPGWRSEIGRPITDHMHDHDDD